MSLRWDQKGHVYEIRIPFLCHLVFIQSFTKNFSENELLSIFKAKPYRATPLHRSLYKRIVLGAFLGCNSMFGRNISHCLRRAEVSGIKGGIKSYEWLCHIKVKDRCPWLQAVTATQDSAIINVLKPSEVLIPPLNTAGDIWLYSFTSKKQYYCNLIKYILVHFTFFLITLLSFFIKCVS